MQHRIIQPEGWKAAKGYANAILTEKGTLYIGGQIGWNADQEFQSDDFIDQMKQALENIVSIVESAGGSVTNITRLTWFIKDKSEYLARQKEIGEAYRIHFGRHFPAMSMIVVKDLIEDRAVLEIEATAELN